MVAANELGGGAVVMAQLCGSLGRGDGEREVSASELGGRARHSYFAAHIGLTGGTNAGVCPPCGGRGPTPVGHDVCSLPVQTGHQAD